MEPEPEVGGNILYVNFVYRCPSTKKCGRKIRVKFLDNHVVTATPVEGGFNLSYSEGEGIRDLTEDDPHTIEEFTVVSQIANQYIKWLNGANVFNGTDKYQPFRRVFFAK
jgi:hypothetical protein